MRPVAPQQASLASSKTTLRPLARSSSARKRAADVPVMPLPIITTSASAGRSSVVRWPRRNWFGSLCQKDLVELGTGSPAGLCEEEEGSGLEEDEVEAMMVGQAKLGRVDSRGP